MPVYVNNIMEILRHMHTHRRGGDETVPMTTSYHTQLRIYKYSVVNRTAKACKYFLTQLLAH